MKLLITVQRYLTSREFDGYAANTIRNDRRSLHKVTRLLGDIPLSDFTADAFDKVMANEQSRGLSPGSINNIISTTRSFTKWCQVRGLMAVDQNPADRRFLKEPPTLHKYIPREQFPAMLDAAKNPRDRMLLAMGLYTLARTNEIQRVTVGDVDLETGYVAMVVTKTHDSDMVPMCKELDQEVRRWLTAYAKECGPLQPEWLLIPGSKSAGYQKQTYDTARSVAKPELVVQAVLPDFTGRTGMHLLRRSSARAMFDTLVEAGYDGALRRVQTWLHHASAKQTEEYIGVTLDRDQRDRETIGQSMFPGVPQIAAVTAIDRFSA